MIKKFFNLLLTLILGSINISFANAQTQDPVNQQDWISRQQQNVMDEKKRDNELETIQKEHERKKKEENELDKKSLKVSKKDANCFPLKEIKFIDANSMSSRDKKKIANSFAGKDLDDKTLGEIVKEVNNYYHSRGFITTQVVIPKQNLQSGVFELQVIEGKIEKISMGKDRFTDKMQKFTAFGNAEGEVLNINDINQGIYQINRLQSNSAVMKVEPGTLNGDSKILIENNKKFPARMTVGKDNLGNQFTGIQRTNVSGSIDNLLSLNDSLSANYTTNMHDDNEIKDIKSFSSTLSIPFKYNTLTLDYSRSEFKGQNIGINGPRVSKGFSEQRKITLDRVLLNYNKLRLSANASLTKKDAATYGNGVKDLNSIRNLSILNVGFVISSYINNTTNLYLKPSYSKGLKILNAVQDQKNIAADAAKAQFDVFKLYVNFSKKFTLPKVNAPMTYTFEMDSQYAKQTLFGSEQFSVGGYYSVRGFRETYLVGDSGYYFRNKVNLNLGSLVLPFFKTEKPGYLTVLNKISFEPFYDYGYAKNKYSDAGSDVRLSGVGIKSIFYSKYFNASATFSHGVNKSKNITSPVKENNILFFEVSANCC